MDRARQVAIWVALADHFLDTETRHLIPYTALRCVEGGLSAGEARHVWCFEVTPVVWHNLHEIAGEWALWPEEWLVREIERTREELAARPDLADEAVYRRRVDTKHDEWIAIEKCIVLLGSREPGDRAALCADLRWLAGHFYDFVPEPLGDRDPRALRALYQASFLPIFAPIAWNDPRRGESIATCRARVERALSLP